MDTNQRNNLLFYVDTILFVIAMSFISINTVIPYFLNTLGATTFEISLASTLVGAYSPFFMSLFSKMIPDKNKGRLFYVPVDICYVPVYSL